jgi:hypothetical protein
MQDPVKKITEAKRNEGMVQVIEHLPGKYKALSSNPNTIKKKKWPGFPVVHACNATYSGGRDQEDHSSNPAPGK